MLTRLIHMMQRVIQPASALMMIGWPLLIWLGLRQQAMGWLLPLMMLLLVFRLFFILRLRLLPQSSLQQQPLQRQAASHPPATPLAGMAVSLSCLALALCVASSLLKQHQLLLYYPVVVNTLLLCLFAASLLRGQPLIERIARWRDPHLPPAAVRYTRNITQVWCVFFIVNGTISLLTCLSGKMALWTLWNGLIAYLAMGVLFAGEWLVRQRIIRRLQP